MLLSVSRADKAFSSASSATYTVGGGQVNTQQQHAGTPGCRELVAREECIMLIDCHYSYTH